jgi:hypothetical protein
MKFFAIVFAFALAACSHSTPAPSAPPPAAPAATAPAGAEEKTGCEVATCGQCIKTGGCWWHTDTNKCTFEQQGCTDGSNCLNGNDHPCP